MNGQLWWYVARSGGFLAWALSAFSILWGLLITSRALGKRISGPRLLDLHRFIGGLSVVFVLVHIFGLWLHSYKNISFGLNELLVPMASKYHPGAVAYGIVAFYLLVAVEITSLLRRRLPATIWRSVHYSGFVVFLLGSIHALKVGTDVQNPVIWWPSAVLCAAIVGLAVTRAMSAAQEAAGKVVPDIEIEIFGADDPWARPVTAPAPAPPVPQPTVAIARPDPVTEALSTTARVDDDRAALLERTRRSLERLDITAYPQAELPAELLTTRPAAAADAAALPLPAEAVLPTRPATDIALRYARLRNPTNPPAGRPPSFQALIPPGAQSQPNWGQPPAGWDEPSAIPLVPPETTPDPIAAPAPIHIAAPAPMPAAPTPEPELAPSAEWAVPEGELAIAPPSPVGLPDPTSRTAWEDQLTPATSSLDWRTPARSVDPAPVATDRDLDYERDEPESALTNVRNGLPSRTPQRLARSTQPARNPLEWKPQRLETVPMGGAPPPPTPDPATGEVPSEQYRVWLREWLAFAESYDG